MIIIVGIPVINFILQSRCAVKVDLTISPTEKEDLNNLTYT